MGTAGHSRGAGTALLKRSSLGLGSGERHGIKICQDWSELGSVSALGNFNYPGDSFTPTFRGCGRKKKKPKSEKQDSETHPLPRALPDLNGYFLNLSFTLP